MPRPLGILANPASGKDIRRLVAGASVFDNREKSAIIRRALAGAVAAGATHCVYLDSPHRLVEDAISALGEAPIAFESVASPRTDSALDTVRAARAFRDAGCGAVIVLGGDGTSRAFCLGWRDAPLVPVSTGTNNVFPRMVEGTVAGAAAGLVASGRVGLDEAAIPAKIVRVSIDGERADVALIDAVFLEGSFIGSRAIWDASGLRTAVLTRAEPASVGISAVGGLLHPVSADDALALVVEFGGDHHVTAPIAPGLFRTVAVREARPLPLGVEVEVTGPGVLAFDGERERALRAGQRARLTVSRTGPRVIDVDRTLRLAALRGLFLVESLEAAHGH